MKFIFGRKQRDLLVRTIEQQATVIDSAEKQVATLSKALAEAERRASEAQENYMAAIHRNGDLRRAKIAELEKPQSRIDCGEL